MRTSHTEQERLLKLLRWERDAAAARGDHGEALVLNDRIADVKAGRLSVERAMRLFESGLARRRARAAAIRRGEP